jgi:streptomycin 6-kinase
MSRTAWGHGGQGVEEHRPVDLEPSRKLRIRLEDRINAWRIVVDRLAETETSILVFGRRGTQPVVLKVLKTPGDEWRSGEILDAFGGKGVVRVYDSVSGALLLERLSPGQSLVNMAVSVDDAATQILAKVIGEMVPRASPATVPTVQEWATSFDLYVASGSVQIPEDLLAEAHRVYTYLCRSQSQPRLLHGDLHHDNVLFDSGRGWLAVDPKGVIGELEYEVGAALRNPWESPDLFTRQSVIETRVERLARELNLDAARVLAWGFAQAVLAVIWTVEDGYSVEPGRQSLRDARAGPAVRSSIGSPAHPQAGRDRRNGASRCRASRRDVRRRCHG